MHLPDHPRQRRPRILTATGSPNVRTRLQQRLQADCHVVHAPDGMTALLVVERCRIDLLVLADDLPNLDAPTIAQLLRRHVPTLPIVLLAAQTEALPDVNLCVRKPWDAAQIADAVLTLLGRKTAPNPIAALPMSHLSDPRIDALILELSAIQQLLEHDQRIQPTRCIRQAIRLLNHTRRRVAALAGPEQL